MLFDASKLEAERDETESFESDPEANNSRAATALYARSRATVQAGTTFVSDIQYLKSMFWGFRERDGEEVLITNKGRVRESVSCSFRDEPWSCKPPQQT